MWDKTVDLQLKLSQFLGVFVKKQACDEFAQVKK